MLLSWHSTCPSRMFCFTNGSYSVTRWCWVAGDRRWRSSNEGWRGVYGSIRACGERRRSLRWRIASDTAAGSQRRDVGQNTSHLPSDCSLSRRLRTVQPPTHRQGLTSDARVIHVKCWCGQMLFLMPAVSIAFWTNPTQSFSYCTKGSSKTCSKMTVSVQYKWIHLITVVIAVVVTEQRAKGDWVQPACVSFVPVRL